MEPTQPAPVVAPASTNSPVPSRPKTGLVMGGAVLVVILLVAVGYFVVAPTMQLSTYKKADTASQLVLTKVTHVFDTFRSGAFTSTNSTSTQDTADLKTASDAVVDARSAITKNAAALTNFPSWPLLDWNNGYHNATQTKKAATAYLTQAKTFLNDYDALVTFMKKSTELAANFETTLSKLDEIAATDSLASLATKLDAIASSAQTLTDQEAALAAPDYMKASQMSEVADSNKLLATFKAMATAARASNANSVITLSAQLNSEIAATTADEQGYIDALQNKSPIADEISKLKDQADLVSFNF